MKERRVREKLNKREVKVRNQRERDSKEEKEKGRISRERRVK